MSPTARGYPREASGRRPAAALVATGVEDHLSRAGGGSERHDGVASVEGLPARIARGREPDPGTVHLGRKIFRQFGPNRHVGSFKVAEDKREFEGVRGTKVLNRASPGELVDVGAGWPARGAPRLSRTEHRVAEEPVRHEGADHIAGTGAG